MQSSTFKFNREILIGELGAVFVVNLVAAAAAHYTRNAAVVASSTIVGSKLGGTLFWLSARIYDQVTGRQFRAKTLASDIGYFTPAAIVLGLLLYDPSIYLTAHALLRQGVPVAAAVTAGQVVAFGLFLLGMNLYRLALYQVRGKSL